MPHPSTCRATLRRSLLGGTAVLAALATTLLTTATTADADAAYPVAPSIVVGGIEAAPNPAAAPAGADLTSCHSTAHPYPVVLIDGTFANQQDDFAALAPSLANAGYCVYTFAYGAPASQYIQSIGAVPTSAQQLATEVTSVRAATGAPQVDLVGHSQGGMLAEYYAKLLGGAPYVHDIVGLAPSTHGTTLGGLASLVTAFPGGTTLLGAACQACADQLNTSPVIRSLDTVPIAQAGVNYTIIETRNETVVTPVGSSFIDEPGVTDEYVQSFCPTDTVDHVDLPYDQVVIRLTENALDPSAKAAPDCATEFPYPA